MIQPERQIVLDPLVWKGNGSRGFADPFCAHCYGMNRPKELHFMPMLKTLRLFLIPAWSRSGIHIAEGHNVCIRLCAVTVFLIALLEVQAAPTLLAEFPFQFREGFLWIEVNIPQSKEPLNFLMDTGAGVSVINLSTAKRIGLKLGQEVMVHGVQAMLTG